MPLVLVVADDRPIRRFTRIVLGANGCDALEADSVAQAVDLWRFQDAQLAIIDIELVQNMRAALATGVWGGAIPVVSMAGPSVEPGSTMRGSQLISRPAVSPLVIGELMAEVGKALGLIEVAARADTLQSGKVSMDFARRMVTKAGQRVHLSGREFDLLLCLGANPDQVIPDQRILQAVWGTPQRRNRALLRTYVEQLREKLEEFPLMPRLLVTEPGVGYRLHVRRA